MLILHCFLPKFVIINNSQIMKSISFRNSAKIIATILAPTDRPQEEAESFYDEDLQFSTFRSDDLHFYDHLPFRPHQQLRD